MMGRFFIEGLPYSERDLAEACIDGPDWGSEISGAESDSWRQDIGEVTKRLLTMRLGTRSPLLSKVKGGLAFNYVGVIAVFRHVFIVLPKYYVPCGRQIADMSWLIGTVQDILAAVSRYHDLRAAAKSLDDITFAPSSPYTTVVQNQMGLYRFLLQDYAEHGPYHEARRIRERDGEGLIDWPSTINQISPVVTGSRPVYMELITTRRRFDDSNFIARVQESVVMEICMLMESSGLGDLFHLPSFTIATQTLASLGGVEYLVMRLERELAVRFDTRSKRLLNALIDYLRGRSRTVDDTVVAEGTTSFNLVWESICQQLFHDRSDELRMPKPHWTYRMDHDMIWDMTASDDTFGVIGQGTVGSAEQSDDESGTDTAEGYGNADPRTLIPDVINKDDPTGWYILDAKYYVPSYGKDFIAGAPGIGDIIKQYFYMMAIVGRSSTIKVLGNAFIVPGRPHAGSETDTTLPKRQRYLLLQRGVVTLDFVNAFLGSGTSMQNDTEIKLFEMDPEQAISRYIDPSEDGTHAGVYLKAMFQPMQAGQQEFVCGGIPAGIV